MSVPFDGADDLILPFAVEPLDLRGRVVRLGPAIDTMIKRHGYPEAVARVLGEAAALTALLGSALKFEGRFQLQTRTDGPVEMIVVDFDTPDRLRAFIRFDAERVAQSVAAGEGDAARLIGHGHLAMTIDQGPAMNRYQGVVPMEGQSLEEAAHQYFRQSEQIPTRVRLAVAEQVGESGSTWRAGGLLAQFMPASIDRQRQADLDPGDAPAGAVADSGGGEDDAWREGRALVDTIADHELVDPGLSSERLLYRLFHERGVRAFSGQPVREGCNCTRDRIMRMLASFSAPERKDMVREDGRIGVTCEFWQGRRTLLRIAQKRHMAHLASGARLFLAVERQTRLRIGEMMLPGLDIVADQVAHCDPPVAPGRAQWPAADGADMLLELRGLRAEIGPVPGIVHAGSDFVDDEGLGSRRVAGEKQLDREDADIIERAGDGMGDLARLLRRCGADSGGHAGQGEDVVLVAVLADVEGREAAIGRAGGDDGELTDEIDEAFQNGGRPLHRSKRAIRITRFADRGLALAIIAETARLQDGGHADGGKRGLKVAGIVHGAERGVAMPRSAMKRFSARRSWLVASAPTPGRKGTRPATSAAASRGTFSNS